MADIAVAERPHAAGEPAHAAPATPDNTNTISGTSTTTTSGRRVLRARRRVVKRPEYNSDGERLYCICRRVDDGTFMIQCDRCEDW
ncbi:Transcription factor bye1 [Polyrhizophydium stewartii]|uniref:Transcription factor bye1 n=1 Tax=Polyrhizophydium stewartii TaxID=2732419 RepID=A0ABR4NLM3_9FUNG